MSSPVAMRLQLRVELKRLRVEAGLTQKHVADTLDWSPSKVIRIENGQVAIGVSDLRALVSLYGMADEDHLGELERLARGSKKLPFAEYRDVISTDGMKYFGYEGSAAVLRQVEPVIIPGLLQTEEYTRGMLSLRDRTAEQIDRIVQTRRERQEILERPEPLLHFILDEGALWRQVRGPAVLRVQLERVLELVRGDRISVQILPFSLGYHEALRGPFVHLEFGIASEADVVYLENNRGGPPQFYEDPEMTGKYKESFYALEDKALPPGESAALLERVVETLEADSPVGDETGL
jgi:transcriptional regulator with XRE-family HTH domain